MGDLREVDAAFIKPLVSWSHAALRQGWAEPQLFSKKSREVRAEYSAFFGGCRTFEPNTRLFFLQNSEPKLAMSHEDEATVNLLAMENLLAKKEE